MIDVLDKNGIPIREGDNVRYFDSFRMWVSSQVIDVGSALAIRTPENPILLYEFIRGYIYDGQPIEEIEVITPPPSSSELSSSPDELT